jgi:transcriptional regulator GlxA family with amidase domain
VRIAIVLYDGFDELDAIGPYEVLKNAETAVEQLEVRLVTRDPADLVTTSHGLTLTPQGVLDDSFDLVIVPGGAWAARSERGAWGEASRGELPAALTRLHDDGARMASVCTGTMILSAAGITRGRPATTHHVALEALGAEGAEVRRERVVDDGDLLTSGGVTSGLDMALWLVEREWGRELADRIARGMEHERRGEVYEARRARTTGNEGVARR